MRTPAVLFVLLLAADAAELPVRHVVLYKNGVGYFERAGEVKPGSAAQLSFKQSEMNDILKSLTVRDAAGRNITGLRYDSAEPVHSKLSTFPFTTGGETPSLSAFLNALRGARISVDKISGTIMLARTVSGGERQAEREQLVVLLDSGEMRTFDLSSIASLQLADAALQARLRDYLRILGQSISADKRVITIESAGNGDRSLTASYMAPAPVWKSSYRLLFGPAGEATLEGWAIVDNTSGEDWTGVRLALVSGRPVSFISNLFETREIQRQTADLPEMAAVNPVMYEGAVASGVVGGVPGGVRGGVIGGIMGAVPAAAPPPPPPPAAKFAASPRMIREDTSSISPTAATGREIADLFEYSFAQPVTVRAGESAMIPFVQQKIGGRKLLIYSDRSSQHPMSAVELTNSTGKTLDGGPVTVFESASYAGEALMATLKAGDKRLIGYAVDLGTRVATRIDSGSQDIREIRLRRGILLVRTAHRTTQTYTIRNVDNRAKTLVIEHPLRSDFKLVGMKPAETTANAYRFEVKLGAGAEEKFPVVEEREYESSLTVSSLSSSALAEYISGRAISPAGRKALEAIAALKAKVEQVQQQHRSTENQIGSLERDSERTRQNVQTLSGVAGQNEQVQRYARQLGELDARVTALRDRQAELEKQRVALTAELNPLIESTEF